MINNTTATTPITTKAIMTTTALTSQQPSSSGGSSSSSTTATPPSSSSSSTSNGSTISESKCYSSIFKKQLNKYFTPPVQLQDWEEMPKHLQFNPYVLKGYRPLQDIKGCVNSLFYLHNESINILTHGIPIVYLLATVPTALNHHWENEFRFLSWCHLIGAISPWIGSFVYHLFMNLEHGEYTYYRLLQLDMLGIWMSQSFGALPFVTATAFCLNRFFKWAVIFSYCILCLWGLYKALTAGSPWQRRLCFALPFCMRIVLAVLRKTRLGGGNPDSFTHIILQDGLSVLGGCIGAMHIPEKWLPGMVDMYLNSHNIMHVLVVSAVFSMHQATVLDIEWMAHGHCPVFSPNVTQLHEEL